MPRLTAPTFLQWLLQQYHGEPRSKGERWCWHTCPICCGHDCFSTQPVGANGKQRFKCYALDAFGDAFDVLILRGGALMQDFGHRCMCMVDLLRKYIAKHGTVGVPMDVVQTLVERGCIEGLHSLTATGCRGKSGDAVLHSLGSSKVHDAIEDARTWREYMNDREEIMNHEVSDAMKHVIGEFESKGYSHETFALVADAVKRCNSYGIHPVAFANWMQFVASIDKDKAEHMAECEDRRCDWYYCRTKRATATVGGAA